MMQNKKAQTVVEIAIFGSILIFLMGVILRSHLGSSQNIEHQAQALKLALQVSNQNSQGIGRPANSSRNAASVLFVEDRLSPDFNKFNNIDRSALIASGSGGMTNRLEYPVDYGEVEQNLPIMDVYVNGQHFPLTTGAYVFRVLYKKTEACPNDYIGFSTTPGPEYIRCRRQQAETDGSGNHDFYGMEVNGTTEYDANAANAKFDLLRNNTWDSSSTCYTKPSDVTCACSSGCWAPTDEDANALKDAFMWQWRYRKALPGYFSEKVPDQPKDLILGLGSGDTRNYPSVDTSGSLREQVLYAVSQAGSFSIPNNSSYAQFLINGNPHLLSLGQALYNKYAALNPGHTFALDNPLGLVAPPKAATPITGVAVLDSQLGDFDQTFDSRNTPGPTPGLMQDMQIYTFVNQGPPGNPGTYLQIKEGKLYNPETNQTVRSISSKNHVDLISRTFQLSNNTGRFCQITCPVGTAWSDSCYSRPAKLIDQNNEPNPVEVCSDSCATTYVSSTCYSPKSRILYIRTHIGDTNTRKWFTDITKGL